ncbi:MAG: PQQ-binding-like beta-propeller repeat protein, partial [Draconibacterium sp.]|nr:PQQ-binding-like beta-propeller repeat protein [Draconibacterium sp.]
NQELVKGNYGEQVFESLFGPVYYSCDAGNTHFSVTPRRGGDHKPSYNTAQVFNWLVNDLAHTDKSKNVVVFNHDLLTFGEQVIFSRRGDKEINLNEHNLKAWIYGHWHINFRKQHGENGPVSVCASPPDKGGIDHSPSNFLVFDIDKNGKIDITPRYCFLSKHIVVNAPNENNILLNEFGNLVVSVNTYHTVSATKNVTVTLKNSRGEIKSVSLLQNSDWNWSAEIPLNNNWKNGELKLIVESIFDNGETVKKEQSYRILQENIQQDILKMQWVTNVKSNVWMAPAIEAKGKLFVATIDDFGMENCGIHAIDTETGLKLWSFKTVGSVKNTICYTDGKILATDVFGISYAINSETGKLIWKKELGQTGLGSFNTGSVVSEDIYYTGYGNYLQAIDAKTGETRWVNEEWQGGEGATPTMIVADNILIAASNWRALYAHDIKTGKLLWKKSDSGYSSRSSSATYLNDTLYVASKDGIGLMNVHTGEMYKYFKSPLSLLASTKPLVLDNLIVMGTAKEGVAAFNRTTGEIVWKVQTGKSLVYSSPYSKPNSATVEPAPILFNGNIIFGASDGFIYVVNSEDGKIIQKMNLGAPVFAAVTLYLNSFFVTDFGGSVYRFLLKNGK